MGSPGDCVWHAADSSRSQNMLLLRLLLMLLWFFVVPKFVVDLPFDFWSYGIIGLKVFVPR